MTVIRQEIFFIASIADAFQYISYYQPKDYIQRTGPGVRARGQSGSQGCHCTDPHQQPHVPRGIARSVRDTGIALVFLKIGMNVQWDASMSVQDMVNEGVRRAYTHPDNKLRASVLLDPAGKRQNSRDNTPAVVHFEVVPGDGVEVICAAKGGGSENKSKMAMLNPSDSIVEWVLKTVPTMGASSPPGILGSASAVRRKRRC